MYKPLFKAKVSPRNALSVFCPPVGKLERESLAGFPRSRVSFSFFQSFTLFPPRRAFKRSFPQHENGFGGGGDK